MEKNIPTTPNKEYINKYIKNNNYSLPTNKDSIYNFLSIYLYTLFNDDKEKEFINKINKENIKELKKINPI